MRSSGTLGKWREPTARWGDSMGSADSRIAWRERVAVLEGRRDRYRDKWGVSLPHERLFNPTGGVSQEWLQEMVDAVDVIVWQLDHEF